MNSEAWYKFYGNTPHHLEYPEKCMYEMVADAAEKYPCNKAYDFMGNSKNYKYVTKPFIVKRRGSKLKV